MPTRDLDRICEIAARLNEEGGRLRTLGLDHVADLLAAAEAELDATVYGNGCRQEIVYGDIILAKPAPLRRAKGREARTH